MPVPPLPEEAGVPTIPEAVAAFNARDFATARTISTELAAAGVRASRGAGHTRGAADARRSVRRGSGRGEGRGARGEVLPSGRGTRRRLCPVQSRGDDRPGNRRPDAGRSGSEGVVSPRGG